MAKVLHFICVAFIAVAALATSAIGASAQSAGATVSASVTILEPVSVLAPTLLSVERGATGEMTVDGALGVRSRAPSAVSGRIVGGFAGRTMSSNMRAGSAGSSEQAVSVSMSRDATGPVTLVYTVAVVY